MRALEETRFCSLGCTDEQDEQLVAAPGMAYCGRHGKALTGALQMAPDVAAHVAAMLRTRSQSESKVSGSRETPLPFNVQAFDDANAIYELLVRMAAQWARELQMVPPLPSRNAWRTGDGTVQGLPASIDQADVRFVVEHLTGWLKPRVQHIVKRPSDVAEHSFRDVRLVFQVNARWPRNPQPYFSRLPCVECRGRIAVYPPARFGDDTTFVCEGCGRVYDESQHEFYTHLFAEQETGERVAKHLKAKYLP